MQEKMDLQKAEHLKIIATSVFNSPNGKELLKILEEHYLKKPVWIHEAKESFAAFREGQNAIVRCLIAWSTPSQTLEK